MKLNQIYNEDNLITLANMPNNFIHLVLTSPPYDNLRTYHGFSFNFEALAKELLRVLIPGGIIVWIVNDATINGSESGTSFKQALFFKEIGLLLHDTMIYQKTGCAMPSPNRYLSNFEYMFIFSKGKPKTFNPINDRKNRFTTRWGKGRVVRNKDGSFSPRPSYTAKEYGRRFNIWKYNNGYGYGHSDKFAFLHPATFPENLAQDHILSWSNPLDIVYDPFLGSGTTAKMAIINNRYFIGSEISYNYCQIALDRIKFTINQKLIT